MNKIDYMNEALLEAKLAFDKGEIPVGAIIVYNDEIIARAHNTNRLENNPILHAEVKAIQQACQMLESERLIDCDLYATKEPCCMCAGAIVHARIRKVYIGASDIKYGACGTVLSVCGNQALNHRPEIEFGVLQDESAEILSQFFRNLRLKKADA